MSDQQYLHKAINDYGKVFVDMRNFCFKKCSNILETHDLTLAEKNCMNNCFKKTLNAYSNFNNLVLNESDKLNNLQEPTFEFKNNDIDSVTKNVTLSDKTISENIL